MEDHPQTPTSPGPVIMEPARRPDGSPLRPVYWEQWGGLIAGPAQAEFLAQTGLGLKETDFWVVADFKGNIVWIRPDRLRSRRQFDEQRPLREVEWIRELE